MRTVIQLSIEIELLDAWDEWRGDLPRGESIRSLLHRVRAPVPVTQLDEEEPVPPTEPSPKA